MLRSRSSPDDPRSFSDDQSSGTPPVTATAIIAGLPPGIFSCTPAEIHRLFIAAWYDLTEPWLRKREVAMNIETFLLKEYELRVNYLVAHFQRMWTRFNFFVTIESALMSALIGGEILFGSKDIAADELTQVRAGLASVGLVLFLIWYAFGAEDRLLVEEYRDQVKKAAMRIQALFPNAGSHGHTGNVDHLERVKLKGLSSWRIEPMSTTRLAALFPLFTFLLWLALLYINLSPGS
jgi:hypothetical protein